jgi:alkylhydroperoxidase family enzyme
MLGFLEKLSQTPESVGPGDVAPLRAAGLSDEAIAQAIHVSAAFHMINRLADSFGFEIPPPEHTALDVIDLLKHGYDR